MSEEENQESQPRGGGGGGKLMILGLLLCNLLSLGGLAAFVLLGSSPPPADAEPADPLADEAEGDKEDGDGKADKKDGEAGQGDGEEVDMPSGSGDLGPTVKLGEFIINLNDPGNPRYLKISLKAEVSADEAKNELRSREPQVRDIVISYLSSLSIKETYGARAKATIRDNIQRRLNHILTTGEVKRVFFTNFMTQ